MYILCTGHMLSCIIKPLEPGLVTLILGVRMMAVLPRNIISNKITTTSFDGLMYRGRSRLGDHGDAGVRPVHRAALTRRGLQTLVHVQPEAGCGGEDVHSPARLWRRDRRSAVRPAAWQPGSHLAQLVGPWYMWGMWQATAHW